ncbi:PIN domain-containing protein [Castellaniella sp. UC4442_H9]
MADDNHSELENLVQQGCISMITIDTSISDGCGNALNSGLFAQLDQFKTGRFGMILSEIVVREIRSHLVAAFEETTSRWRATAHRLGHIPELTGQVEAMGIALAQFSGEDLADRELKQFMARTGATVLPIEPELLPKVLDSYFATKPPFGPKDKRSEFPDALALLGIEQWCQTKKCGVMVVSSDGDWKRYCESSTSGRLFFVNSLSEALKIFNSAAQHDPRAVAIQHQVISALETGDLVLTMQRQLRQLLLSNTIPRGESRDFAYLADIVSVEVGTPSFSEPSIVRQDATRFVVSTKMQAHCGFVARFAFYDAENDFPIGSSVIGLDRPFDATALITNDGGSLSVEVALSNDKPTIDFGEVWPDTMVVPASQTKDEYPRPPSSRSAFSS